MKTQPTKSEIKLRDRFAAAAITGLLANPKLDPLLQDWLWELKKDGPAIDAFSEMAYNIADSMMEERGLLPRNTKLPEAPPSSQKPTTETR